MKRRIFLSLLALPVIGIKAVKSAIFPEEKQFFDPEKQMTAGFPDEITNNPWSNEAWLQAHESEITRVFERSVIKLPESAGEKGKIGRFSTFLRYKKVGKQNSQLGTF